MTWTTYATGPAGLVLCWHVGHVARDLAAALPGWTVRGASSPTAPAPEARGRVVLVGYSAGCQGLRAALLGPIPHPEAVVTIDGTHSSWPPLAQHVALWRGLAGEARRGERMWLATTLGAHRYTEQIPGGKAYASTATVLELALDLPTDALRQPLGLDEGALHVRSYPSAAMDAPAHAAQVREVLPALWREIVVPHLTGRADTDPAPAPASEATPVPGGEPLSLGLRALAWLGVQAVQGVREIPGPKHDPRILSYSAACRRGGTFLGVEGPGRPLWSGGSLLALGRDEDAWCAAVQSAALLGALLPGETPPHGLRVSVRELVEDARGTGALRLPGSGYDPRPGDLAIMGRAGGDPLRGGQGHVHRVVQLDGARYLAVGGNEADSIQVAWHPRAAVLAWIAYP
jgi:hypothetical protein